MPHTPEHQQQLISQNQLRQRSGVGELQGSELDLFLGQLEAQEVREQQRASIADAFAGREQQADDLFQAFRDAGLNRAGVRLRDANRRDALRTANQGLLGGSVDAQNQLNAQAQARLGASQAVQQAEQARQGELATAFQQQQGLQQQVNQLNPFRTAAQGAPIADLQRQLGTIGRQSAIDTQGREIQAGIGGLQGQIIGGGLSTLGQGISGRIGLNAQADRRQELDTLLAGGG